MTVSKTSIVTNSLLIKDYVNEHFGESCECDWIESPEPSLSHRVACCILSHPIENNWPSQLERFSGLVIANDEGEGVDIVIKNLLSQSGLQRLPKLLDKVVNYNLLIQSNRAEIKKQKQFNKQMNQISIALSAEKELSRLLAMILEESRKLSECEAASLYLVDRKEPDNPVLRFKLFQNEKFNIPVSEKTFPLNHSSIAGYVALTGQTLNIPDVYQLENTPYVFDSSFDKRYLYRTREILTLPMRNHNQEVIGILQILNRKNPSVQGKPFDDDACELLQAMASQSAIALDNSLLIENIRDLFEGFVTASVTAIEARDPITSGHSFRVADYTLGLAKMLPNIKISDLDSKELSLDEMRELRYAALLHDFGKVGVREHILQKAKKLSLEQLTIIQWRVHYFREKITANFYQKALTNKTSLDELSFTVWFEQYFSELKEQTERLNFYLKVIAEANEPALLHEDHQQKLDEIRQTILPGFEESVNVLSTEEFLSLSVTRGSLTHIEREEIESHVRHTFEFLKLIPWTADLKNIPYIAGAHHEKMDGTGYPFGLEQSDIPVQTRMMTIADIYDALTAQDRPYKAAVPKDRALDILVKEAQNGKLDVQLVEAFIQGHVYDIQFTKPN